jgi:hypothetical protein
MKTHLLPALLIVAVNTAVVVAALVAALGRGHAAREDVYLVAGGLAIAVSLGIAVVVARRQA